MGVYASFTGIVICFYFFIKRKRIAHSIFGGSGIPVLLVLLVWVMTVSKTNAQILNGSFTNAGTSWITTGSFHATNSGFTDYNSAPGYAYFSATDGQIGDSNGISGTLTQSVNMPSSFTSANIQFYTKITTQETTTTSKYDYMNCTVTDGTTNSNFQIQLSNLDASSGYVLRTLTIPTTMAGHNVTLTFYAQNDAAKGTVFRIDDVSLNINSTNSNNLTITVTNVDGATTDNAQIKLYNGTYTQVLQTVYTNASGIAVFSNLSNANYNYEVYYTPTNTNIPVSPNQEFWGAGAVTIKGSALSKIFTRIQPYIANAPVFTSTTLPLGQTASGTFTVKNPNNYSENSYVQVWFDRDKSTLWDGVSGNSSEAKAISSNSSSSFVETTHPSDTGTYYLYAVVYTNVNGNYIVTDQYAWAKAFVDNPATIQWSGYTWDLTNGVVEKPGPNNWSSNNSNVWVDAQQNLHLKITKVGGSWYCPQLALEKTLGYGEYMFQVNSRIDQLDKNVVLGMFTYQGNNTGFSPQEYEIDMEYSTWNNTIAPNNGDFVFQYRPTNAGNQIKACNFKTVLAGNPSTQKFQWTQGHLYFQSYIGHYNTMPGQSFLIKDTIYNDTRVPPQAQEKLVINLYLNNGMYSSVNYTGPSDQQPVEVIIQSFTFTKNFATCSTPSAPTLTYGSDACSAPTVLNGTTANLSFTSNGGTQFSGAVSKYPYGTANIVAPLACQTGTTAFQASGLTKGMIYRWNMSAYGSTDCSSCQSTISNTKYFSIPPEITSTGTSGAVTLSTNAQNPGTGATVSYRWLKDGQPIPQTINLTNIGVSTPGTYTLINDYSGSANCAGTISTAASNAIMITAGTGSGGGCVSSVTPIGINAVVTGTLGSGPVVQLSLLGGSLGTNASWHWYADNCGGTALSASGTSITVNPAVSTTYYVRGEGCDISNCANVTVNVSPGCTASVMPTAITPSANYISPGTPIQLTLTGGLLGTNSSWVLCSGSCGGPTASSGRGGVFNLTPQVTTTYYLEAVGSCNVPGCISVTVYVVGQPTITSVNPLTSKAGETVTISGTNFTGATSVSFGGVAATSFIVNSATSISAVVGAGASGNVSVTTPGGTASFGSFVFVFSLAQNNFTIVTTSATCRGSNNGSVNISAVQSLNYAATITGNGVNAPYPFTNATNINNLTAGTYNVCITVAGQSNYQQCYTVVITEPKDLSVYVASIGPNQVVLNLSGGANYTVNLNGVVTTTSASQLTLTLAAGANRILVSTDKACQGVVEKDINLSPDKFVYPNPFDNTLRLKVGPEVIRKAVIQVYSIDGRIVYNKSFNNASGSLLLDLAGLPAGQYLLHLSADNTETVIKIIKR